MNVENNFGLKDISRVRSFFSESKLTTINQVCKLIKEERFSKHPQHISYVDDS